MSNEQTSREMLEHTTTRRGQSFDEDVKLSMAISLKRIADMMEVVIHNEKHYNLMDVMEAIGRRS